MCLDYLVKVIARVLSPYITYFSIQVMAFWHQIFTNCWNNSQQLFLSCLLIWGIMQERVYNKGKIANVEELCQRIVDEWERLDCALSTAQWRSGENDCKRVLCWRRTVWTWTVTPDATVLLQLCIMTLPFNRLTAYNIWCDCFQCSLTLSVICSHCKAL